MKTIKDRVSEILHEALRGYNQSERYRTKDGFVRWGLVEKDIIAAIDEVAAPPTAIDWQPIETAPKDGTMVLVYFTVAGTSVVHLAWYNSAEEWVRSGAKFDGWNTIEEWEGWWSYTRGSVTQEKLDEWQTPTHWAPWNGPQEGGRFSSFLATASCMGLLRRMRNENRRSTRDYLAKLTIRVTGCAAVCAIRVDPLVSRFYWMENEAET